ncbi:Amino acid transporter family protein [Spironucleus salmonicida]|uniref:Amino acid transporter family protein n=1 Tax=Spironucleus salmonicida TaxID=348837 RepID=V6LUD0_9EUKA|nr:Amino acid transporter family protein [Spironucleus salmonicida]|eukprot:EST44414.1 Amino acid transporter family protein [Spironucleus salmonicida]
MRKVPLQFQIASTLLNCCFGSGLLSIPIVAQRIGLFWFVLYNLTAVIFSCFVFHQIINEHTRNKCTQPTLTTMISAKFGRFWTFLIDLSIIFCLLPVSYIAVSAGNIGQAISTWANLPQLTENSWQIGLKFICGLLVMFPLSLLKTIKVLNFISSFCILFVFLTVLYVIGQFFSWLATGRILNRDHVAPILQVWPANDNYILTFTFITMFLSLYSMTASIPCIMREYVQDFNITVPEMKLRMRQAVFYITIPVAFCIYTGFGILSLFFFDFTCVRDASGNQVDPGCFQINSNVILAFAGDQTATVIMLLFSIVVFVSFPCMLYPIRRSIIQFFKIDADLATFKGYLKYNIIGFSVTIVCIVITSFLSAIDEIQSFTSNLLGMFLYGMSGLMIWYKQGIVLDIPDSINNSVEESPEINYEENQLQAANENGSKDELLQIETAKVQQQPLPILRTAIFSVFSFVLIGLNVLAMSCQLYSLIRP